MENKYITVIKIECEDLEDVKGVVEELRALVAVRDGNNFWAVCCDSMENGVLLNYDSIFFDMIDDDKIDLELINAFPWTEAIENSSIASLIFRHEIIYFNL
uniref:PlxyGVORF19 protein n=1 Tax=Plutella xylostella granulovirus TaxID=98383 RepID=A0A1B2CSD3_9BBAC|nr:PlxyGVORF19 protein [Plutella xylostella granulovirus]